MSQPEETLHICAPSPGSRLDGMCERSDRLEREGGEEAARLTRNARFLTHVRAAKGVFDAALVAGMQREG